MKTKVSDLFNDQSDEWWLNYLTRLYSRLDVPIDIGVVQAIRKARAAYVPGSSVLTTVREVSQEMEVPWYKLFIFFAYGFGMADSIINYNLEFEPPGLRPPS